MLLLREPFWLLFLTAFIGILFGRMKGRPGWGFLLGLFLGPLGLALMLLLPARVVRFRLSRRGQWLRIALRIPIPIRARLSALRQVRGPIRQGLFPLRQPAGADPLRSARARPRLIRQKTRNSPETDPFR